MQLRPDSRFHGTTTIADAWLGNAGTPDHWRDTHYQVDGPAVAQMQAAFMDNWIKMHATVLHGDLYFPFIEEQGPYRCQMFKSSPMEGSESARLMYLLSITAAEKNLRVVNACFIPDDLVTDAHRSGAARSGGGGRGARGAFGLPAGAQGIPSPLAGDCD